LQIQALCSDFGVQLAGEFNDFQRNSLRNGTGNFWRPNKEFFGANREFNRWVVSVHFSHTCSAGASDAIFLTAIFAGEEGEMSDKPLSRRALRPEAFWRAHHEAWGAGGCGSALNFARQLPNAAHLALQDDQLMPEH
jgi:hypothetical protein